MGKTKKNPFRRELIRDFILFGLLVLLGGGFLIHLILRAADHPSLFAQQARWIGAFAACFLVMILLSAGALYKIARSQLQLYQSQLHAIRVKADVAPHTGKTSPALTDEVNWLFKQLSSVADHLGGCACTLTEHTSCQAKIIRELSGIVQEIASGRLNGPAELREKMLDLAADMRRNVESSHANMETMQQVAGQLEIIRDRIGDTFHGDEQTT